MPVLRDLKIQRHRGAEQRLPGVVPGGRELGAVHALESWPQSTRHHFELDERSSRGFVERGEWDAGDHLPTILPSARRGDGLEVRREIGSFAGVAGWTRHARPGAVVMRPRSRRMLLADEAFAETVRTSH